MATAITIGAVIALTTVAIGIGAVINAVHVNRQKHATDAVRNNHHHSPA